MPFRGTEDVRRLKSKVSEVAVDDEADLRLVLPALLRFHSHYVADLVRVTRRCIPGNHNPLCAVLQVHSITDLQPGLIRASFQCMEWRRVLHGSILRYRMSSPMTAIRAGIGKGVKLADAGIGKSWVERSTSHF